MSDDAAALKRLMTARWSCRAFRPDPVATEVIEDLVETARHTASWNNTQPWQILVTQGAATERFRAALLEEVRTGQPGPDFDWPESYPDELGDRRRACGYALYEAAGIARRDYDARAQQGMRNYAFFDAPHVAILHTPQVLGTYGAVDAGGFLTAFMLAATARGVATIAQAAVSGYAAMIRSHFGLANDRLILCAISFGYADQDDPVNRYRTARESVNTLLKISG
ncbi:MAG: nitroreductase [Pseudomonadota bacterium]